MQTQITIIIIIVLLVLIWWLWPDVQSLGDELTSAFGVETVRGRRRRGGRRRHRRGGWRRGRAAGAYTGYPWGYGWYPWYHSTSYYPVYEPVPVPVSDNEPAVMWCGPDGNCHHNEGTISSHADKASISNCPPGYKDIGFKTYDLMWPWPDEYKRICQKI